MIASSPSSKKCLVGPALPDIHTRTATMPEVSWDTFERYRQKGLDARRAGQWDSARIYLLEAARAMTFLAKDAVGEDLQQGRRDMAARLLELARDCEKAKEENRRQPQIRRGATNSAKSETTAEGEGEKSASQWIVKEKPS